MINGSDCCSGLHTVYLLKPKANPFYTNQAQLRNFPNSHLTNVPIVAVFIKSCQFNVISTYLTLNLAFSDISYQIFVIIPFLYLVTNRPSCTSEIIFNVIRNFIFTTSKCFVALMSYDRYQHIKNPNRYAQIITLEKIRRLQLASIAVALSVAGLYFSVVDNTFLCNGSFASNRDCDRLFLCMINSY